MRMLLLTLVSLVVLSAVAHVAYRSYAAVAADFERFPAAPMLKHPERAGIGSLGEVSFRLDNGARVAGWYVPSRNRASVVVTHGTSSDRSSMVPEVRILSEAGFGVLAFDWPGDGASEGEARWGAEDRQALTAAIDWLSARPDVDTGRVGGLGFSMGGYVMAQVAAKDSRLCAVMLVATPTDYADLTHWQHRRWGLLSEWPAELALRRFGMPTTDLRPIDEVGEIAPRPLALLRGSADDIVPEYMTRALYAAAREPKSLWIIPGAKHGGYAQVAPGEYRSRLVQFFSDNLVISDARCNAPIVSAAGKRFPGLRG
jgi:dipeptidyl aminopeptidase/acylaminoacyl peptidase